MNTLRRAFLTSVTAASVVLLAAWAVPSAPQINPAQEGRGATTHTPVSADGNYSFTDAAGNYQAALQGAVLKANDALTHANGQIISDLMFSWQVYAVTGTRGGIAGNQSVTVTVHVLQ